MAILKSALIVSSEDTTLQKLQGQLQQLGFEQILTIKKVSDALELAYSEKPDILLVNSHIEGRLDAKGVLQAVDGANIPVILLEGKASPLQQKNHVSLDYTNGVEATQKAIEKAISGHDRTPTSGKDTFFIRTNNRYYRVKSSSIRWIESDGNYSIIQCADKKFILKMSLRKVLQELTCYNFIQIHKRFIVNADEIEYIDVSEAKVYLNDKEIPIGRRYKDELLGRLNCLK